MAINKKLIHFKSKENFEKEVANENILDTSICFIQDSKEISTHGTVYKSVNWSILKPPVEEQYLTIINTGNTPLTVSLNTNTPVSIDYSLSTAKEWTTSTSIIVPSKTEVQLRSNLVPNDTYGIGTFNITGGSCEVKGNVMSLLYSDDFKNKTDLSDKPYAFAKLFNGCVALTHADKLCLPAIILSEFCYHYMFFDCSNLKSAPELPATTLAEQCYSYMFYSCAKLLKAPQLLATELAYGCYAYMFSFCISMTNATELPATTLTDYCYCYMFYNCSDLISGPTILPASVLTTKCYAFMFQGCTSLIKAPELQATTLLEGCYQNMFSDCTGLLQATELPATELTKNCYNSMFKGCVNLVTGPSQLPAQTLTESCYYSMFEGCGKLIEVPELLATTLADNCYQNMFKNCNSLTIINSLPATTLAKHCYQSMFEGCSNLITVPTVLPATELAEYCYSNMFQGCTNLSSTPELPAEILVNNCYQSMFQDCRALTSTPVLASVTLANYCYQSMFQGCTNLVSSCELPATVLTQYCYYSMFRNCSSLIEAPALPAMELAYGCYYSMFNSCIALTSTPELPATKMAEYCYYSMFNNCTGLVEVTKLPATVLAYGCYGNMFNHCISITETPELWAETLYSGCYENMFYECSSLKNIFMLAINIEANNCLKNFAYGTADTGVFIKNSENLSLQTGPSGIPYNWALLNYEDTVYFTISNTGEENLNVQLLLNDEPQTLSYRTANSKESWITAENVININVGESLEFKSDLVPVEGYGIGTFNITNSEYSIGGNVTSLLYNDDFKDYLALNEPDTFIHLFKDSTNLIDAENLILLPLVVTNNCYKEIFKGCINLTKAPKKLYATTLAPSCYESMFEGCLNLISTPKLPLATLANSCYKNMFKNCELITNTLEKLPASVLSDYCYYGMFEGCKSLTQAPELLGDSLKPSCYERMFYNCENLNFIKLYAKNIDADNSLRDWTYNVSQTGTFIKYPTTTIETGVDGIPENWEITEDSTMVNMVITNTSAEPLTIELITNNVSRVLEGRVLNQEWISSETHYLEPYSSIELKGGLTKMTSQDGIGTFKITGGTYSISGDVKSLIQHKQLDSYNFSKLFQNCTTLISAKDLILSDTLAEYCYSNMFSGCTSLTTAPKLPATTLASGCYYGMFYNCISLTIAPELSSTTLTSNCYQYMFRSCTSLVEAPELPATTLANGCYSNMFSGCTNLTMAPELPATTLASSCYSEMFYGCTSLTTAPKLPATTLTTSCYNHMFYGCKKLNYIMMLATDISANNCLYYWVKGVASSGTLVKHPEMTSLSTGMSGIPTGWTVEDYAILLDCISLEITADDVIGNDTTTTIYYTARCNALDIYNNPVVIEKTGKVTSEEFPQNTSETETIEHTISFTYMGITATTTITQGAWLNQSYTIDLNNNWQVSSKPNPDATLYDGVYESYSNKGVNNIAATMYIDIFGYTNFKLYIRSYAESNYDYIMVSQLDQNINNNTSYSNTTLVKAHTRGKQTSGTSLSNYTLVEFTGIDSGKHRITIVYRKDGSGASGDDKGYVFIEK